MAVINVQTIGELEAALVPANAGATINVAAGDYEVTQPLVVPAGATLVGVGVMQAIYQASAMRADLPQSRLKASAALVGDIVRLSDGAALERMTIEDVPSGAAAQRAGNLVAVTSTQPDDRISARIESCELVNPNPSNALPSGPIGRCLLVVTRNPDEGSRLTVTLRRSVTRSGGNGSGIFAINFAPRGRVLLQLSRNRIGGGLDANGGVSRPAVVTGAHTRILSDRNRYQSDGIEAPAGVGWLLHGGSNPPVPFFTPAYTQGNSLTMRSYRDTIAGFQVGIVAAGGWRPLGTAGPVSYCCADIEMDNLGLEDLEVPFVFAGAKAGQGSDVDPPPFAPGDDNLLRVTGSPFWASVSQLGPQESVLDTSLLRHTASARDSDLPDPGSGNRLELYGIKFDDEQQLGALEDFYCGPRFEASGP